MEPALASFVARPDRSGIFMDFDGTLSRIVGVPHEARPLPGVGDTLRRLEDRFAVVAVVSGRRADQLVDWLGPGIEIWGLHGAERVEAGRVVVAPEAARHLPALSAARAAAAGLLGDPAFDGVRLEDKGTMFALHWREAADPGAASRAVSAAVDEIVARYGLKRGDGRMVAEVRPPLTLGKGGVVLDRARAAGLRAAAFVGDDRVDLEAFDALDELEAGGVACVRVAVRSDESPPELLARADVVVEGPEGALRLLGSWAGD